MRGPTAAATHHRAPRAAPPRALTRMSKDGSRRSLIAAALAALVLVAFVERFCGLAFQLPYEREGDPAIVHAAAFHDRPAGAEPTDAAYPSTVYPLLLPRVLEAAPGTNYPRSAPA